MPGWSTDLNSPSRLTTPTLPCWTILTKRERNRAPIPTPARTAMMTIPNTSPADANTCGTSLLLTVGGVDDEQTSLDVGDDDIGPDGNRGVGVEGDGEPLLTPGPDPSGVVCALNGLDH